MKNWEFRFFLPGEKREDDGKTFGLTASECYPADAAMTVLGEAFGGSYESVLSGLERYAADAKETIYSAMILFRENVGNEAFIKAFSALFPGVPCAGGTAAQTEEHGPRVLPGEGEVAVKMCIRDSACTVDHRRLPPCFHGPPGRNGRRCQDGNGHEVYGPRRRWRHVP